MVSMTNGLIGANQRKATTLRRKAELYHLMRKAILANTVDRYPWPNYVPRGKSPDWYLTRAARYTQQAEDAEAMAHALHDLEHQHTLDTISAESAERRLMAHLEGIEGFLRVFSPDWPKLMAALPEDRRAEMRTRVDVLAQWIRERIR
jgi:hypothetical protein